MLQVKSLTCRRGKRTVFRDVSFSLQAGESLMVMGANGSGKSSLLRCMTGLLPVCEGSVLWSGLDIKAESTILFNYVGHMDAVKPEFTVLQTLSYWQTLYGGSTLSQDPFGMLPMASKQVYQLSAGQKRRLALSRLFLTESKLWILDEPATALDKEGQNIITECITAHCRDSGIAVIATHHELSLPGSKHYQMLGN